MSPAERKRRQRERDRARGDAEQVPTDVATAERMAALAARVAKLEAALIERDSVIKRFDRVGTSDQNNGNADVDWAI